LTMPSRMPPSSRSGCHSMARKSSSAGQVKKTLSGGSVPPTPSPLPAARGVDARRAPASLRR
jgi:hypothetical protein